MELENRAAFVKNEFRYGIAENAAVLADEPNAREIIIDASLDEESAQALADAYLNETEIFGMAFELSIEGIISAKDFAGHPPLFRVTLPNHNIPTFRVFRAVYVSPDYMSGRTTIRVRA
ncbi:hypothetical protein PX699_00175 [Sphingobium sp. H39-3-25]|uniref:hypothetical protein n=1 Tax=Sphingobium arseniciresistens TaxID=3030834 RepID=UPI0023B953D7|nr:hypothetical protein [Sphingobium arseniciresistens]